jgi:Chaperone of endosialidase
MSTGSTKDTTTASTTDPWAPQAAALTSAFGNAQTAYNTASQAVAPTNFTAQMDPTQIAAYNQMVSQGSDLGVSNTQAGTGAALQSSGVSGVNGALSGLSNYNPSATNNGATVGSTAQQFVDAQNIPAQVAAATEAATQQARDVTMPGIEQNAATSGNTNSTRTGIADGLVQRGLAENAQNLTGSLTGQAEAQAQALAQTQANNNNTNTLGALSTAGNIGNTAASTGVNAGTASVGTQGALSSEEAAGGAGLTAAQQAILTNQEQQFQSQTQSPYAALNGLMGVIGSNNWGSSTNGTSDTTSTPSAWDTISGLMSSAGALGKGIGGAGTATTAGTGLMGLFSDWRVKTNIVRLGTLDNGLPLYSFEYIGDPEKRMNIGLMAQDVELVKPEAVSEYNGIKMVNYTLACS